MEFQYFYLKLKKTPNALNECEYLFSMVLLAAALLSKCQSPCSSKSFGLSQIIAANQEHIGEVFQEMLKLKLCTPLKNLIWKGISIEKTTAVKKSHKFHLVRPFIVRDREPFLNFHGSALVVFGTIPDRRASSQEAKMDLSKSSIF